MRTPALLTLAFVAALFAGPVLTGAESNGISRTGQPLPYAAAK